MNSNLLLAVNDCEEAYLMKMTTLCVEFNLKERRADAMNQCFDVISGLYLIISSINLFENLGHSLSIRLSSYNRQIN